jgi:hypothetical protein
MRRRRLLRRGTSLAAAIGRIVQRFDRFVVPLGSGCLFAGVMRMDADA